MKKSRITLPVIALSALSLFPAGAKTQVFQKSDAPEYAQTQTRKQAKEKAQEAEKKLEDGWAEAERLFGGALGKIREPRISANEIPAKSFSALFSGDSPFQSYPLGNGQMVVLEALNKNALKVNYPEGAGITPQDAQAIAKYAYLCIGLSGRESEKAEYFSFEAVTFLYSRLGTKDSSAIQCTSDQACAGFAIFFTNPSDPLAFLKLYADGKTNTVAFAIETYLGRGAWKAIMTANLNGSNELSEIFRRLLARPDSRKLTGEYIRFMQDKFKADVSSLQVKSIPLSAFGQE
ncbi:MAG: hypothetical protein NT051_03420 [Candidatus Micrarchaeota archaeon]|nr:hypothetical protein [Candidatus Micrarchaeota archaeon]